MIFQKSVRTSNKMQKNHRYYYQSFLLGNANVLLSCEKRKLLVLTA